MVIQEDQVEEEVKITVQQEQVEQQHPMVILVEIPLLVHQQVQVEVEDLHKQDLTIQLQVVKVEMELLHPLRVHL